MTFHAKRYSGRSAKSAARMREEQLHELTQMRAAWLQRGQQKGNRRNGVQPNAHESRARYRGES